MKSAFFCTFLLFLFATPATAQQLWASHALPIHANTAGHGELMLSDWDSDGDTDLVAVTTELRISKNSYPGIWDTWSSGHYDFGDMYNGAFADLDGDGDPDVLFDGNPELGWLENLGEYQFTPHILPGGHGGDLSAGDIDGDGDNDFVIGAGVTDPGISVWINDGDGNFTGSQAFVAAGDGFRISKLADFNDDGLLDFVAVASNSVIIFIAEPGSIFVDHRLRSDYFSVQPAEIVDFDHDGDPDILLSEHLYREPLGSRRILYLENVDGTSFDYHVLWTAFPGDPRAIVPLDVNLDGYTDIAYGNQMLINTGDNLTFAARMYSEGNEPQPFTDVQLKAADIDGDGDMDILNQEVRWFVNPYISRRIEIGLDAMQTNVPANGGFITYHGALRNYMANPRYLRVWSTVTFPGGNESTVWTMRRVFQPDQVYEADTIQQYIPPAAPPGTYTFTVHFGDPDQLDVIGDSFQFEKHE